jgi:iduronate 2-sulfatase
MKYTCIVTLVVLSTSLPAAAAPAARTNVVFIVIDDLCCELGCYGVSEVRSPNIDRLAARGVRFDRAYCQWPVCNPSRTSFLTGLRPDATGIHENQTPFRQKLPDVVTLPQLFRQNGYFTAGLGKIIHAGLEPKTGKRVFFQDEKSWDDCRNFEATAEGRKGEGRRLTPNEGPIKWLSAQGGDDDQPDGQIAAAAVKVLEENRDKPFFLGVGLHKPHDPFHAPKKYFDLYPLKQVTLHTPPADRTPDLPPAIARKSDLYKMGEQEGRELKRAYHACTTFTDAQVGRVLDALDRLQLWDRTVVVLLGDHGYHLGEHEWWNKSTVFEMSARTPLIIWAPGAKGMGKPANGLVEFVDLYPTLADLCGLTPPPGQELAGVSLRPLLDDPTKPGKSAAFTQRGQGRTVRTDRWRYTEWDEGRKGVELYDHSNDPLEYHNLAGDPKRAARLAELKEILHRGKP